MNKRSLQLRTNFMSSLHGQFTDAGDSKFATANNTRSYLLLNDLGCISLYYRRLQAYRLCETETRGVFFDSFVRADFGRNMITRLQVLLTTLLQQYYL